MTLALWILFGYVLGSFPTSYVAGRLAGVDLREHGSKNLGATNVYRVLGWAYAVPVALVDAAKGAVPVLLAARSAGDAEWMPLLVGLAAVTGHVFSIFLRFKGGKGVATAAGAVLALAPGSLGVSAVVWVTVLLATGYVSLASMLGALAFPIATRVITPSSTYTFWTGVGLVVFIFYTHRTNIGRLLAGNENRFGRRARATEKDT